MAYKEVIGWKAIIFSILLLSLFTVGLSYLTHNLTFELGLIASLFTFVYGFFLNSIFKFLDGKATRFRESMAVFQGTILAIGSMIHTFPSDEKNKVKKELVSFLNRFIQERPDNYHRTQKGIPSLYKSFSSLKIRNKEQNNIHTRFFQLLSTVSSARESLELFGHRYLVGEMRLIYVVFTGTLSLLILLLTLGHPLLRVLGVILVLLLIFISRLLFMLDRMEYGKAYVIDENLKQLIEQLKGI